MGWSLGVSLAILLPPPPSSVAAHRNMMASATGFEVDRSYLLRVYLGPRERTCVVFFGRCRAPDCSYPCTSSSSLARLELLRWFAFYCVGLRGHVCAPCFMGIFVFHSCLGLSRTVYKRNAFGARMLGELLTFIHNSHTAHASQSRSVLVVSMYIGRAVRHRR